MCRIMPWPTSKWWDWNSRQAPILQQKPPKTKAYILQLKILKTKPHRRDSSRECAEIWKKSPSIPQGNPPPCGA